MIFEIISKFVGLLKLSVYKLVYFRRICFKGIPKVNANLHLAIKKKSKLVISRGFKCRNNVTIRIYDGGLVEIGKNVFFNDGVSINCRKHIVIGDNVIIGPNTMIFDHDHDYRGDINNFIESDVAIGDNTWIGANCILLKGIKIGNNNVIAASTTLYQDTNDSSVVHEKKQIIQKGHDYE